MITVENAACSVCALELQTKVNVHSKQAVLKALPGAEGR